MNQQNYVKLTIGLPVYNGEKFLKKRIENILSQTNKDFILLISDNFSTDDTQKICQEFANKDPRIKYVRQTRTSTLLDNLNFVIKEANTEYFALTGVDDFWSLNFFEDNLVILEKNSEIVGSIGNVYYFDDYTQFDIGKLDKKNYNKIHVRATSGEYEERLSKYIDYPQTSILHAIFRTKAFQKSAIQHRILGWDRAAIYRLLKHGNFYVSKNSSYYKYSKGYSSNPSLPYSTLVLRKLPFIEAMLVYFPFTIISLKSIGLKNFLKNIKFFALMNFRGERRFFKELLKSKNFF